MAYLQEGYNQRGEKTVEKQAEERAAAIPKPTLWENQLIAWNGLLKAIKNDNDNTEFAKSKGLPLLDRNAFAKAWFKENWHLAVVWGTILIVVVKLLSGKIKPQSRGSYSGGHHGINRFGERY